MSKTKHLDRKLSQREIEAAERYIAADKSDPFARARVMTHMRNGVCNTWDAELHDGPTQYTADESFEVRINSMTQEDYKAPIYINRRRP